MSNQEIVSNLPALPTAISYWGLRSITSMSRGKQSRIVPQNRAAPGLIKCNPMLDLGNSVKQRPRIMREIGHKLLLIQQSTISLIQRIGQVPMEQCHKGSDAFCEQVIYEFLVESYASRVYGVVAAP